MSDFLFGWMLGMIVIGVIFSIKYNRQARRYQRLLDECLEDLRIQ